jgi:hypothetical protein
MLLILLDKEFVKLDIYDAIDHLTLLRNNLVALNKLDYPSTIKNITMIESIANSCKCDFNNFGKTNHIDMENISKTINTHEAYTLQGIQYNSKLAKSDVYSDELYEKYNIMQLVAYLDAITIVLERAKNFKQKLQGFIKLDNIHKLIRTLVSLTKGNPYMSYDDIFGDLDNVAMLQHALKYEVGLDSDNESETTSGIIINDKNCYMNKLSKDYGVDNIPYTTARSNVFDVSQTQQGFGIHKNDGEYYANDEYMPLFTQAEKVTNQLRNNNNTALNAQYMGDSGVTAMIKRNTIPNYIPVCDINQIKTDKERMAKFLLDTQFNRSLRDDYANL